jgi:thiamine transport system permease protein
MLPLGTSAVTIGFGFVLALDEPPLDLRGSPLLVPLAQALVAVPFVVRSLLPALRTVQPRLRDAAAVLGASPASVWRHVDLPLVARPAVGALAFALAISLGEFGATVFVARSDAPTLPIVVERLLGQPGELNVAQAMAVATVLAVVTAAVVAVVELAGRGLTGGEGTDG